MPLRDHFHPPMSIDRPWEGFHSTWATVIAQQLNDTLLPSEYVAIPHVRRGTAIEVDVGTFRQMIPVEQFSATWKPTQPAWSAPVEWNERDLFEIRVVDQRGGPRLVGAIELVSPANKDRPTHRQTFAGKCAGYLRQNVGLIVVDVVTQRHDSLHSELLDLLELNGFALPAFESNLYAVAYRAMETDSHPQLDVWPEALAVGTPLPTLPLWLAPEIAIPVNLEESYQTTCRSLRIGL